MTKPEAVSVERIDYSTIRLEFDGPLATITLNDPARLNAMGEAMGRELATALTEIAKPRRRCRALLIAAEGRAFCSGVDLMGNRKAIAEGTNTIETIGRLEALFHPMLRRFHALRIPVVASVNGLAIGIGLGLILTADHVVASEAAWFQTPFKNLASGADSGATWLLPRMIGPLRAKQMLLRAERVDAATALDWGLVTEVVAPEALAARARDVAWEFANDATLAIGEIKVMINDGARTDLHTAFEAETAGVARTARTKDNVAAVRVFGKKGEKPVFTGE